MIRASGVPVSPFLARVTAIGVVLVACASAASSAVSPATRRVAATASTLVARASASQADAAEESYSYLAGLAEKGLHDLVVKEARAFLNEHPRHARARHARYRLGAALLELGSNAEALAALEDPASERAFEFVGEANVRIARAALRGGDPARAEKAATRALEWGREYLHPLAHAARAESRAALENWSGALADHEAVLARQPTPEAESEARLGRAWCAWRSGDAERGAEFARAFVARAESNPKDGGAPTAGSKPLASDRRPDAARVDVARVILGECELDLGRAEAALQSFRSVRDAGSLDAAGRGAGHALVTLGRHADAAREFAAVLERTRDAAVAADCALRCGMARLEAGDAPGARAVLSDPRAGSGATTGFWRARAELESGDAAAALATADRALAAQPDAEWRAHLETARGAALERLGRTREAAEAYARSGSSAGSLALCNAHLAAGKYVEARDQALALLKGKTPLAEPAPAWRVLGEAHLALEEHEAGERAFLEAARLERDPKLAARALLRAGWCRHAQGDASSAVVHFEAALRGALDETDREEASFLAARATELAGRAADASQRYRRHVEEHPRGAHAIEACVRHARLADDERAIAILTGLAESGASGEWIDLATFDLAERLSSAGRHAESEARYAAVGGRTRDASLAQRARYGRAWSAWSRGDAPAARRALDELLAPDSAAARPSKGTAPRSAGLTPELERAALDLSVFVAIAEVDVARAVDAWRALALVTRDEDASVELHARARDVFELARKQGDRPRAEVLVAALSARQAPGAREWAVTCAARLALDAGDLESCARRLASAPPAGAAPSKADALHDEARAAVTFALAEALFEKKDDARALPFYESVASRTGPLGEAARYKAGFTRLRGGDFAGAEREFARLVEVAPRGTYAVEALYLRGEALARLERFDDAAAVLTRARDEGPGHAVASKVLFRLGVVEGRRGRHAESRAALDALMAREPNFPAAAEVDVWRGRALAGLGDARAARAAFERAVARGESAAAETARLELGRLLSASGDHEGALQAFLKVALLSGSAETVPEALWLAGAELESLGQPARAKDRYREILTEHASSPFAARARERVARLAEDPKARPASAPTRKP